MPLASSFLSVCVHSLGDLHAHGFKYHQVNPMLLLPAWTSSLNSSLPHFSAGCLMDISDVALPELNSQ